MLSWVMTIRQGWVAYRDANLVAFKLRHRGSRFAGTAQMNTTKHKGSNLPPTP